MSTLASSTRPTTKKAATDRIAVRPESVAALMAPNTSGPIPDSLENTEKKPKNSAEASSGIIVP